MSRSRLNENEGLLPEQVNPDLWPTIDEASLTEHSRKIYQNRKTAVLMYFKREKSLHEIKQVTTIDQQNLRRLIKRCMSSDEMGGIWGFRALIPQKKVKAYQFNVLSKVSNKSRKTGEFNLLLETYPDLRDLIEDLYLGRNRRSLEPAMTPKSIHKRFIEECRRKEIPQSSYPFNTMWMGFRALRRYLNRLGQLHFARTAAFRYGQDAETKALHTGEGEQNYPSTLIPYQRVQFDAHRIDGIYCVEINTPEGDTVPIILERFWILSLIDVATRCILGYSLSLAREISASDVMHCVRNAVLPHKKLKLTIDGLTYHSVGGFPSAVFPETNSWAVWDVICYDNAKAHLANLVKDRLKSLIGCVTNLGPVALPMRRSLIERFFKTLEESGFHRLPNTTGSHPDDPRRNDPEKKAIQWKITYDHLKELVDVLISNYNGTPHGGIHHQRPLELLAKRMGNGLLPRRLEETKRSEMLFLQTVIKRKVRGSLSTGRRPYIQYEGVEYRSEKLNHAAYLINQELTLHVNVDDIRIVKAFLEDGSEFDYLTAAGKWCLSPHSLTTRKAINSLVTQGLLHYTSWDDPIFVYTDFLLKNANKGKRGAVNKFTHLKEVKREAVEQPAGRKQALDSVKQQHEALDKARELKQQLQQEQEIESYEKMLSMFKTKS
ncbi:hypothetical protein PC41400_16625 [Paenibacillus chitinolyticus]|uniref:Integrase catalytic domain-containing protein n=1 Tax=Paenibacillus chitinolyticus TaxID=79263 RepID=A0A410WXS7_9BACL|nr:hypothetical protein [Paenibacillus chitinolyticus]MCY9589844.1 hypothetical protein [Paenibacillus chitinolyticus]MCY9598155.1 hypothetical protein [Paenibacillus chitinolyticus]QAV19218.1 hypothetical protein PC41400_16625 [Paenibacillus chitinolyticus]